MSASGGIKEDETLKKSLKKQTQRRSLILKCQICERNFNDAYNLRIHQMQHENIYPHECPDCGKKFRQRNKMQMHRIIHRDPSIKPYKCKICDKGFRFRDYLNKHQRWHESTANQTDCKPSKLYQCESCNQTFRSLHMRRVHYQIVHATEDQHKENVFRCPVALCGKFFFVNCKLESHLKRHSDRREYKCNICKRGFFERGHLKSHQMIHTDVKPFQCEICPASFQRKFNLEQHRKIHLK